MQTTPHGWKIFDPRTPILLYEYGFGPGKANALAVGGKNGLIVVSPPCRVASGAFEDLAQYGPVRALVASNAFHHLGLPEWKARFPDAEIFAPAQSIKRVKKQSKLSSIRPLSEASSIAGERVELTDMPHYKTGEVLVRIKTDRGIAWYVTDIIMNLSELPRQPLVRSLFRLSGSGPGLKFNNIAPLFMVRNRKALRRWLANEYRSAPPSWMIASHGEIADFTANPEAGRELFAKY